jgi:antitoxin (DNA-binding transcriptional repressor) of toxin-antitoxin stability system
LKGHRVVIAKVGQPCLDLLPNQPQRAARTPGRLRWDIHPAPDFDQSPDDLIADFEGS